MEAQVATAGIDGAYDVAFEAHWSAVFRFALAWTNDHAAAEDLAQEAFLRLWKNGARIDWDRPLLPWLLVTTRRLATDRFRAIRRAVYPRHSGVTQQDGLDEWLDLQAAMSVLSPLERTALVLTRLDGHSYADAAEVLGTSAGALRAAVSRAREKLEAG